MSSYDVMKQEVKRILDEKNIQKVPQNVVKLLDDIFHAEKLSGNWAKERGEKAESQLVKVLGDLKARDHKNLAEVLNENELTTEDLERRAFIHAGLVRDLAILKENYARRLQELTERIEYSNGKVPFSQKDKFNKILVELSRSNALQDSTENTES